MRALRKVFFNVGLMGVAVISGFAIIELTLRLFFPVTDIRYFTYDPEIGIHLEPNQEGVVVIGAFAEGQGRFRVNEDGWNSIRDYERQKSDKTLRLAVIGDSFVGGTSVDIEKMFPIVAEERLRQAPSCQGFEKIEGYSFGVGGVPMSHYPDLMRYADRTFDPDAFVVLIYPGNDFGPSLLPPDAPSKLPYTVFKATPEGQFDRVDHMPFYPSPLRRMLSKLATVRYLYGNLDLGSLPALKRLGLKHDPATKAFQVPPETMKAFTDYIFGEYKKIAADKPLLVLIDADRHAIYGDPERTDYSRYIGYAQDAAHLHQIDYRPLDPAFRESFAKIGERFEYPSDEHWNSRANQVAGDVVASWAEGTFCESAFAADQIIEPATK